MWLLCDWPLSPCLPVATVRWGPSRPGAVGLRVHQWLFTRFVLASVRWAAWPRSVAPWPRGPSGSAPWPAEASHDAGLDVLVGDLLVVVVGAAARRVHRGGRHGVEREHELLSVAHARRLGVVPRDTCEAQKVLIKYSGGNSEQFDLTYVSMNEKIVLVSNVVEKHLTVIQIFYYFYNYFLP